MPSTVYVLCINVLPSCSWTTELPIFFFSICVKRWLIPRESSSKNVLYHWMSLSFLKGNFSNLVKREKCNQWICAFKHENLLLVLLKICLWFSVSLWQIYWFFPFLSFLLISTYFYSFLLISTCFYLFLLIYLSYIYLFLPTFNYSYLSLLISTHLFDLFLLVSTYFYLFLLVSIEIIGFSCLHLGSLHPRIFVFYFGSKWKKICVTNLI